MQVSVVMPCLNESATIGACISKAKMALKEMRAEGEVIVADNRSTDDSVRIAESLGARVVHQPERGYGNTCRAGIEAAKGKYIVMGDADDTHDFGEIPKFVKILEEGYDLVIGSRLRGEILPGAMSWSHMVGNLFLTGVLNLLFGAGVSDAHCGTRAFKREAYERMCLRGEGMEFASEMVIAAVVRGMRIGEVPIRYYPRGEGSSSKLRALRDGWRHMKEIFTPREIAELLHVAPTTIYAELERGRLPHARIGRKYIITRRQLEDYLSKEVVEELLGEKEDISEWLDSSAEDMAKAIASAEEDVPESELREWLEAMKSAVKPLEGDDVFRR